MSKKRWKAIDRFIRSAFMMPMYQLEQYAEEDAGTFKLVCAYKALFKDLM
jgi:hypothetical protein